MLPLVPDVAAPEFNCSIPLSPFPAKPVESDMWPLFPVTPAFIDARWMEPLVVTVL